MNDEPLTIAGLHRALSKSKVDMVPFEPQTLSVEQVNQLRTFSVEDLRAAPIASIFGMPMLRRSDGNYRVMNPKDKAHLGLHDGGRPGCEECWRIWGGTYR